MLANIIMATLRPSHHHDQGTNCREKTLTRSKNESKKKLESSAVEKMQKTHVQLAGLGITGSAIWRFLQSKHGFSAFSHIFSAADDSSFSHFHFLTSSIFSSRQFVPFVPFDRDHDLNDKKHPFHGCRSRGMTSGFTFPSYKLTNTGSKISTSCG